MSDLECAWKEGYYVAINEFLEKINDILFHFNTDMFSPYNALNKLKHEYKKRLKR